MVGKKFLCAAPRQECWEEKMEALLKSLGDEKKQAQALKQTLQVLREQHNHEKRSGPGRKSHAENAISFYEYALAKATNVCSDEDEENEGLGTASTSSSDSKEEGHTVGSMDSAEFLNQHNDLCDVCNEGGELLCCSTCNLVFHLECVRPTLEVVPAGEWSCPHCIISGSPVVVQEKTEKQILKKSSKVWKAAAAGVRQMGRLRKAAKRIKDSNGSEEKDDNSPASGETDNISTKDDGDDQEQNSETKSKKSKKNMKCYTITTSLQPSLNNGDDNGGIRRKRPRKPVILYDPQEGPASEWRSDGNLQWITKAAAKIVVAQKHEDGPEKNASIMGKRKQDSTQNSSSESGESDDDDDDNATKWCKFCRDDPNVPVCIFCACRVCFGKHDKEKILLCDKCDEEYHIYCLTPPLTSIPKGSKKWYCPNCDTTEAPRLHKTRSTSAALPTTTPKSESNLSVTVPPTAATSSSAKGSSSSGTTIGRARGRQLKIPTNTTPAHKRGRPKSTSPTPTLPKSATPAPRKRGRPPKDATVASTSTVDSKKRTASIVDTTSSKKVKSTNAETITTDDIENELELVKTSRSGRMLKRSSFHDERDEGEQHLRSPRYHTQDKTVSTTSTQATTARTFAIESTKKKKANAPKSLDDKKPLLKKTTPAPKTASTFMIPSVAPATKKTNVVTIGVKPVTKDQSLKEKAPSSTVSSQTLANDNVSLVNVRIEEKSNVVTKPKESQSIDTSASQLMLPSKKKEETLDKTPKASLAGLSKKGKGSSVSKRQLPPQAAANKKAKVPSTGATLPTSSSTGKKVEPETFLSGSQKVKIPVAPLVAAVKTVAAASDAPNIDIPGLVAAAIRNATEETQEEEEKQNSPAKIPRRKPGARECMQISRRFGVRVVPKKYMATLLDYCTRGKVEHLIRMRERLDEHSRYLESQLAGLEALVQEKGESDIIVPPLPDRQENPSKSQSSTPAD